MVNRRSSDVTATRHNVSLRGICVDQEKEAAAIVKYHQEDITHGMAAYTIYLKSK